MKRRGLLMSSQDNVVVVLEDCQTNDCIEYLGGQLEVNQPIQFGHKVAISDINKDEDVTKYGETIGYALEKIEKGNWIHNHNMGCHRGRK